MADENHKNSPTKMTLNEFYPYYLREHQDPTSRMLHYFGSSLVLAILVVAIWQQNPWWLLLAPIAGYGCAWIGHYFFEKNKPATFSYPTLSFISDWIMFKDFLTGQIDRKMAQAITGSSS